MKFDIPIRNKDGNIQTMLTATDEQMRDILEFGLNFLLATGLAAAYGVKLPNTLDPQASPKLND